MVRAESLPQRGCRSGYMEHRRAPARRQWAGPACHALPVTLAIRSPAAANRRRLVVVFALTLTVFVVEVVGALASGSLALLADAGHVFTDVVGIGLAPRGDLGRRPTGRRTAGRSASCGSRSSQRRSTRSCCSGWPPTCCSRPGGVWASHRRSPPALMLAVAIGGLAVNARLVRLLLRDAQRTSLNMRGAYLEVIGDLAGSATVIVAALVIIATGWLAADPHRLGGHRAADPAADDRPAARRARTSCSRPPRRAWTSRRSGGTSSARPAWRTCTTCTPGRSRRA